MGHHLSKEEYKELCKSTSHGRINFHDRVTIINRLDGRIQRGEELMSEELEALFRLKEPVDEQVTDEDMDSVFVMRSLKFMISFIWLIISFAKTTIVWSIRRANDLL